MFCNANGGASLFYEDVGSGPAIVITHGVTESLRWPRFAGREVRFLKWILAACFGFPCLVLLRSRRACGKSE